jgi:hypothetical protein
MSMEKHFLILGGYGATGQQLAQLLLSHTSVSLSLAGHNRQKAERLAQDLRQAFPGRSIEACYVEARDPQSLQKALQGIDLLIVTATVPEQAGQLAEAALQAGCDYFDILVRPMVIRQLEGLQDRIQGQGRLFVTQGGFHPGLIAPAVHYAANHFEQLRHVRISMAMNLKLAQARSGKEIVDDAYDYQAEVFSEGAWRAFSYQDAPQIDFGEPYGIKSCMAMQMEELKPLPAQYGLQSLGTYVAGFNWFVDNIVFSLIYLTGKIKKGLGSGFFQRLMKWGIDTFSSGPEWLVFLVEAEGSREGQKQRLRWRAVSEDGYWLTAICMLGFLKQYLARETHQPGLYLMGNWVDAQALWAELESMGFQLAKLEPK